MSSRRAVSLHSLLCLKDAPLAHPMASAGSSSDAGAPDGGRTATAGASGRDLVDEAALHKLAELALAADNSGRFAFAAALWGHAVAAATETHGDNLVAVRCTLEQATCLISQTSATTSPDERRLYHEESWALTSSVLPLLSTRMDANTLLPGRCTKAEVEFQKRLVLVKGQIKDAPPFSAHDSQLLGFGVGYDACCASRTFALHSSPATTQHLGNHGVSSPHNGDGTLHSLMYSCDSTLTMFSFADASCFAQFKGNHI